MHTKFKKVTPKVFVSKAKCLDITSVALPFNLLISGYDTDNMCNKIKSGGRTGGRAGGRTDGRAGGRAGGRTGGRTDGRTDRWMDGQMDRQVKTDIHTHSYW